MPRAGISPAHLAGGSHRAAVTQARDRIAYLWAEVFGHPGWLLAPALGVRQQAVYQAVARGRQARAEWERLFGS